MESAAKTGEVLVNNLLYEELRGRQDIAFDERPEVTKSGESFLGWSMTVT
jgi:hypothetical protein